MSSLVPLQCDANVCVDENVESGLSLPEHGCSFNFDVFASQKRHGFFDSSVLNCHGHRFTAHRTPGTAWNVCNGNLEGNPIFVGAPSKDVFTTLRKGKVMVIKGENVAGSISVATSPADLVSTRPSTSTA